MIHLQDMAAVATKLGAQRCKVDVMDAADPALPTERALLLALKVRLLQLEKRQTEDTSDASVFEADGQR